jgi:hypothetical protein
MSILKHELDEGLLESNIVTTADSQIIVETAGSSEKTAALFADIVTDINLVLSKVPYPTKGRFSIIDLAENKMVVFIFLGEYQWNILINSRNVKLGLFLTIVMPKIIAAFEDAGKS